MAVTDKQIEELETFFAKAKLPVTLHLESGVMISEVIRFVASHLAVLKHNADKPIYEVFYDRLLKAKELIQGK